MINDQRRFPGAFFAALALAFTFLNLVASSAALAQQPKQPNILWLSCEDLSPRLGCYGDNTVPTPNIDRLAKQGIRYTNAFTATGVCAPCRNTIITGLYPMESGAQYMRTGSRSAAIEEMEDEELRERVKQRKLYEATPPAGVRCFTEYLREAGYYCTNNSKQDYQFKAPVTAWDVSSRQAHYKNRAEGQPFFAVFNNTVTHESGIFGDGRSPRVVDPDTVPVPSFLPDTPIVRRDIAWHYDNVAALDKWVGKQLDDLEEAGLADSTIVVFFTDHGSGLPRHKRWVYDSGTHVPLIVRFPDGYGAGTVDDRLMSFVDLAPTTLAMAGLERPNYMRGRVFTGPNADPSPEYVFMHRDRMDDASFETIRAIRDKRYRYIRNYRPELPYLQPVPYRDRAATMGEIYRLKEAGELNENQWHWTATSKPEEELYDLQNDPDEVHNLAADPQHKEKLQELRSALSAWITEINDPLATPEMEVLRTRVWPPEGEQPVTANPEILVTEEAVNSAGKQQVRVTIKCETDGASIGYRLDGEGAWMIYTEPIDTVAAQIEVQAHRIGWKPAMVTRELQ